MEQIVHDIRRHSNSVIGDRHFHEVAFFLRGNGYGPALKTVFDGIVKGRASSKTQVRNTSSLVLVLSLLAKYKGNKKVAFAIVDGGCTNEIGLVALRNSVKSQSKIYALDSVGANTTLTVTEDSNQKSFKIHPDLDSLGNVILSEKIDDELLIRQRQKIETILEER